MCVVLCGLHFQHCDMDLSSFFNFYFILGDDGSEEKSNDEVGTMDL